MLGRIAGEHSSRTEYQLARLMRDAAHHTVMLEELKAKIVAKGNIWLN